MKNKIHHRQLGRTAKRRGYLMDNLTSQLLEHGSITTTAAKAKELRKHLEPLITFAKSELTLHNRRILLSRLGQQPDLQRLVAVAKACGERAGGYTRLAKLPISRHDSAALVRIDIIDFDAVK